MNTIYWHDYETTGTDPARDRPIQFAGIRTDENLEIVGEPLTVYCKPSRDVLPHPDAAMVTGITPQQAEAEGLAEPDFIARIHEELSRPGTCGAGYNSLRFDDEVTRYTLYRNFFDPYEREWKHGNSRWDIIDMVRLTHALRPEGIQWPEGDNGAASFKLEALTAANGIAHEAAHDALSDVHATIALARLIRERQPKLYRYVYEHRAKHKAAALVDLAGRKPLLHVSTRLPRENAYTGLLVPLCQHPVNKNAVIAYNLSADPEPLLSLDAEAIKERLFTPAEELAEGMERLPLKAIHLNRCPVLATPKLMDAKAAERLNIDLDACERHWHRLKDADLGAKLGQVFAPPQRPDEDAETALYQGFLNDSDRAMLPAVRQAGAEELTPDAFPFRDERYQTLLFRYRARYFPQSLTPEEQHEWEEFRFHRLTDPGDGYLSLDGYFEELERLAQEHAGDSGKQAVIRSLRSWGDEIL